MSQIADFFCFDVPQFTSKIIQGVPIRALYNLDQHPKKSKEQEEEDLFLLDEIWFISAQFNMIVNNTRSIEMILYLYLRN